MKKSIFTVAALSLLMAGQAHADETTEQELAKAEKALAEEVATLNAELAPKDTTKVKSNGKPVESDRNVMMNAESSTSPRTINIGIPISGDSCFPQDFVIKKSFV